MCFYTLRKKNQNLHRFDRFQWLWRMANGKNALFHSINTNHVYMSFLHFYHFEIYFMKKIRFLIGFVSFCLNLQSKTDFVIAVKHITKSNTEIPLIMKLPSDILSKLIYYSTQLRESLRFVSVYLHVMHVGVL